MQNAIATVCLSGGLNEKLLAFTDLARFTGRLAGNLSGGMKQKLGLACALIRRPRLLVRYRNEWCITTPSSPTCCSTRRPANHSAW